MDVLPGGRAILALERRIAFDAAGTATAAKTLHSAALFGPDAAHHADIAATPVGSAARETSASLMDATGQDAPSGAIGRSGLFEAPRPTASRDTSVVFIESDVSDIPALIKDIDPSARVVMLDAGKDGVDAIADYLATHAGVQNVYIFSHGSEGDLSLGTATLDAASMQGRYAADLATIRASLAPDANILVYGCDFAENTDGDSAAHLLASLTGANVAASTNLTGGTAEGGDFVLEDQIGTLSAPDILAPTIAADYDGVLASPTTIFATSGTGQYHANLEFLTFANTTLATGGITNGATATYTTSDGSTVTATFSAVSNAADEATFKPAAFSAYMPSKLSTGYNNTASTSEQLYGGYNGTSSFTVTFAATDKNGHSYSPNIAFLDSEVTETSGEYYKVTSNGGGFQNVETVGATGYALTGVGMQTIMLSNDRAGVPVLVTTGATSLNITVEIAGGKEGFALALVEPTLTLDANNSSGSTGSNYVTTFTEKGAGVAIADADATAIEPGVTNAASAQIVLTNAQAGDLLSVGTLPSGITGSVNTSVAGQVTVNLAGSASLASYEAAIQAVRFSSTSSDPSTVDRTIDVTFNDGNQNSNTAVTTVHVVAVDDPPVETVPGAQTTSKDTALAMSGLSVSDIDAHGGMETTTLSVADGTISLASTAGLTFSNGTGTNDTSETFTGTLSAIDNAVAELTYRPNTGYTGSDALTFATDDNGNTGTGGAKTTSQTVGITVNNVNPVDKGVIANQRFTDGQAGVSIATAQAFADGLGLPLTYSAAGLPTGLTLNAATGAITGQLDHDASRNAPATSGSGATLDGTYTVVETASDGQNGSTTQTFTIDATNRTPVVGTVTADRSNNDGETITAVNAAAAFSDPNGDPLTYTASGLPAGLAISAAGVISGTVAGDARPGTDAVTVTATDDKGAAATETFRWSVADVPPTAIPPLPDQVAYDGASLDTPTANGFTNPNGLPLTYTATGLPSGLAIDPATGLIAGTLDHDASVLATGGVYTIAATASDGQGGSATNTFHLTATNQAPVVGTPTPDQTSSDGQSVAALDASQAFADANGDPLTYAASDLPAGLAIDASTGRIAGRVAADARVGVYAVTVVATDDKGAATPETFTWSVADTPPVATGMLADTAAPDGQAGIALATASAFISPDGQLLTYTAIGLPGGLAIDSRTGQITGTLDHDASAHAPVERGTGATLDGTYTITVTATDAQGGSATQTFAFDAINGAPVVTTPTANQMGTDGSTASLDAAIAFSDPNAGDVLTYTATGLPQGLAIDPLTGVIAGTLDRSASVTSPTIVMVTATDDKGAATSETFAWSVADAPPAAGPPIVLGSVPDGSTIAPFDTAGDFTSPNGLPLTYVATGLPAGLAIDPITGIVTGTLDHDASANAPVVSGAGATQEGSYAVVVTAGDGQGGRASQIFMLTASNQAPTVTTQMPDQRSADGAVVSLDAGRTFADPNGDPLAFSATGLPQGLAIDPAMGVIGGTIDPHASAVSPFSVTVTATDDKGSATSETFAVAVADTPPMAISPAAPIALSAVPDGTTIPPFDTAFAFTNPDGLPLTYSVAGLPVGLTIDPATGIVTGTLDRDASAVAPLVSGTGAAQRGTYTVVVTASDGQDGLASQAFVVDASDQAPVVGTKTSDQQSTDGDAVSVNAASAFSDPNGDPLTFAASGLPKGLAIDPVTGVIAGTVDPRASVYGPCAVIVTATDDKGASVSEIFVWRVGDAAVTAGAPVAPVSLPDGSPVTPIDAGSHFSDPTGLPLIYSATGLPAGLSIDPATGSITGTLDHDASLNAPVTSGSGATLEGTYEVSVAASDGQGGSAAQSFAIVAGNRAPVQVAGIADRTGQAGQTIAPLATAPDFVDPDGDRLTFHATGLPPGLTLDPATGVMSGTLAPAIVVPSAYPVTIVATDDKAASTSGSFVFRVAPIQPSTRPPSPPPVLPLASLGTADAFIPLATTRGETILNDGIRADPMPPARLGSDVAAATPVLEVINLTSGDQEQSVVIRADDIVLATVNNVRPLDGLQELTTPNAGIVRSGAATNERGDRFDRASGAFATMLEAIGASVDTAGASLIDSSVSTVGDGTAINIETVLRDSLLTITLDNRSAIACVVPVASYAVTRADGSPLPPWLRLESRGVVVGKVPGGVERIDLRVTSTLRNGIVQERTVRIRTDNGTIQPWPVQVPLHHVGRSLSDMVAALRPASMAGAPAAGYRLARFLD